MHFSVKDWGHRGIARDHVRVALIWRWAGAAPVMRRSHRRRAFSAALAAERNFALFGRWPCQRPADARWQNRGALWCRAARVAGDFRHRAIAGDRIIVHTRRTDRTFEVARTGWLYQRRRNGVIFMAGGWRPAG